MQNKKNEDTKIVRKHDDAENSNLHNHKDLDEQLKEANLHLEEMLDLDISFEEIAQMLQNDDSFSEEIALILADLNEESMDLTKIRTKLMHFLRKYLHNIASGQIAGQKDKYQEIVELNQQQVEEDLLIVTNHLAHKYKAIAEIETDGDYKNITEQSKKDLTRIVKNFAIYEIYKCMNPRRIAGETEQSNFLHNVVIRGIDVAKKYTPKAKIATYSPKLIEKAKAKHNSLTRG